MRISDWSSDVCSSDLPAQVAGHRDTGRRHPPLAVGQGPEVGRGLVLAVASRAGTAGAVRQRDLGLAVGAARAGREQPRMLLLRERDPDRTGADSALPLSIVPQAQPPAGSNPTGI